MRFLPTMGHYLSLKDLNNIAQHKYSAGPSTALDACLDVFWSRLVLLLPRTIAPNVITLLGFFASALGFVSMMLTCSDLVSPAPSWSCFLMALGVFLHQTLDALDGKQARRTKTSSPLGSIFDHGCDIFTISFVSISTVALFRCGFGLQSVAIIVFSAHLSQFLYLWWDYHFHIFCSNPGFGAGVTEAQCVVIVMAALTGVIGADIWFFDLFTWIRPHLFSAATPSCDLRQPWLKYTVLPSLRLPLNTCLVGIVLVSNILADARMIHLAAQKLPAERKRVAFSQLFGFLAFLVFECVFYFGVVHLRGTFPLPGFLLFITVYGLLAVRLLLSSTAKKEYAAIQVPALPFMCLATVILYRWTADYRAVAVWETAALLWLSEHLMSLLWSVAIGYGIFVLITAWIAVEQISSFLSIQCFSIGRNGAAREEQVKQD